MCACNANPVFRSGVLGEDSNGSNASHVGVLLWTFSWGCCLQIVRHSSSLHTAESEF